MSLKSFFKKTVKEAIPFSSYKQEKLGLRAKPAGPSAPFDPGDRVGATINGQSGVEQPAMRLGWTNNGRTYANSPFNGVNPTYYQQPQAPMSFGGQGLPSGPSGGNMPPAGAQTPQGPPTMQAPPNPQLIQAAILRSRGGMMT